MFKPTRVPKDFFANSLTATCVAILALIHSLTDPVMAQEERIPFTCTESAFIVQGQQAQLHQIDPISGAPLTSSALQLPNGNAIEVNNLGFRSSDGLLYGLQVTLQTGTNVQVVQIDSFGQVFPLGRPAEDSLPIDVGFNAGDISSDGTEMYLSHFDHEFLYVLDLTSVPALPAAARLRIDARGPNDLPIDNPGIVLDWAYNKDDGLLYGGDRDDGEVAVLDPRTGTRRDFAVAPIDESVPDLQAGRPTQYGAAWFDAEGQLTLVENGGKLYKIDVSDLSNLEVVASSEVDPSVRNDGAACSASCAPEDQPLDRTCDTSQPIQYVNGAMECSRPSDTSNVARIAQASAMAQSELGVYFYELTAEPVSSFGDFPRTGKKSTLRFLSEDGSERGRRESTVFDNGGRYEFHSFDGTVFIDASLERGSGRQCSSDQPATNVQISGTVLGQSYDIDFGAVDDGSIFLDIQADTELRQSYILTSSLIKSDLPTGWASFSADSWQDACYDACVLTCNIVTIPGSVSCEDICYLACYVVLF